MLVLGEGVGGYECTTFSELDVMVSIDDLEESVQGGTSVVLELRERVLSFEGFTLEENVSAASA